MDVYEACPQDVWKLVQLGSYHTESSLSQLKSPWFVFDWKAFLFMGLVGFSYVFFTLPLKKYKIRVIWNASFFKNDLLLISVYIYHLFSFSAGIDNLFITSLQCIHLKSKHLCETPSSSYSITYCMTY